MEWWRSYVSTSVTVLDSNEGVIEDEGNDDEGVEARRREEDKTEGETVIRSP